jgi:1-acyl-sn-glycerol-3-phosphate acyltransferase
MVYYKIRNALIWGIAGIALFLIFIPYMVLWLITLPFDRKKYAIQKFTQWWSTFYISILPGTKVIIEGKEKLKKDRASIVIANHQSLVDILALFHTFAYFIWVSKIENFKVPVLGPVMKLNGYISINRENPKSFPKMFEGIRKALNDNRPILMFPEGTRSRSYQIGRFKDGAFKAAIENKVPIQPIVIDGSYIGLKQKKNDLDMVIKVKIMDPVPYEKFPSYDSGILKEYFRDMMKEELEKMRQS